jgi:hypothetical protein
MAIVSGNPVLSGFSGTLGGNLVFRQYGNKTIVSVKREPRKTRRNRPSILQQMGHDKFREASKYARQLFRDPDVHDRYKKLAKKQGKHSAYNLVISEYMRRVKISTEDGPYSVKKSPKRIKLTIDKGGYAVKEVTVSITRNGQTVNEGTANRISGNNWVYSLHPNPAHQHPQMEPGDVMCVRVVDAFGNETIKDLSVS